MQTIENQLFALIIGGEGGTQTAYTNTLIINQLSHFVTRQRHKLQNSFWQGDR